MILIRIDVVERRRLMFDWSGYNGEWEGGRIGGSKYR